MVVFEKRGKHIGILITLPTIKGQKAEKFRHTYEALFTQTLKDQYKRTIGREVASEIDHRNGDALFNRFPGCEPLILELRRRGWLKISVYTTVDDLLGLAVDLWSGKTGQKPVRSLDDKRNKVAAVSREFPGTRLAHQVSADDIEAYKQKLFAEGYADQTVLHRMQTLFMAFKLGKLYEKVEKIPYFKMPKVDNESDADAYFEDEEVTALLPDLPERLRGLVKIGIADGSISADTEVRTVMLAVLGMCNSVINWRAGDRGHMRQLASELGRLAIGGLGGPGTAVARSRQ